MSVKCQTFPGHTTQCTIPRCTRGLQDLTRQFTAALSKITRDDVEQDKGVNSSYNNTVDGY